MYRKRLSYSDFSEFFSTSRGQPKHADPVSTMRPASLNPGRFFKLLMIRLLTIPVCLFWAVSLLCMHISSAMMNTSERWFRFCTVGIINRPEEAEVAQFESEPVSQKYAV